MIMPWQQKIAVLVIAGGVCLYILNLVRKRRLNVRYSWYWLVVGALLFLLALLSPALGWVTHALGMGVPTSALFFLGIIFLLVVCIYYSARISEMHDRLETLTRALAIVEEGRQGMPAHAHRRVNPRRQR